MKMRRGFITNSSSASYVVKFRTTLSESEVRCLLGMNRLTDLVTQRLIPRFGLQREGDMWVVTDHTIMFNDMDSFELYNVFVSRVRKGEIAGVKIIRDDTYEDNYDDLNDEWWDDEGTCRECLGPCPSDERFCCDECEKDYWNELGDDDE